MSQGNNPCACQFLDSDPPDCKVYGQLGDDVLIGWSKASQECLDLHSIKVQSIDPNTLKGMFPNPDGSGANPSAFVNYLRFQAGTSAVNGIRLSFDEFFAEDVTRAGTAVLRETIVVKGVTYECKPSENDCWNTALKTYFAEEPGKSEMEEVAVDLYNRQKLDRELEQSTVRIAICSESGDVCEPLKAEIEDRKKNASGCSAFGLGPAENEIPPSCTGQSASAGPPPPALNPTISASLLAFTLLGLGSMVT